MRQWGGVLAFVAAAVTLFGSCYLLYDPDSRIPAGASYPFETGLRGANATIRGELERLESSLAEELTVELELQEPVFRLAFPHNLIDRLFDKRKENAVVFSAEAPDGMRFRFLVLRDGESPQILAVAPLSQAFAGNDAEGTFIELPANLIESDSPLSTLRAAAEALLPELESAESERLSSSEYAIFGPFGGNAEQGRQLASSLQDNVVLAHLVDSIETAEADVSVAAPVYSLLETTASAIYLPAYGLAQRAFWNGADLEASLGHELTHAYVDRNLPEGDLLEFLPYFLEAHPKLFGQVIPIFYAELANQGDVEGSVEESLAFIMGSLADGRTSTKHIIRPEFPSDDITQYRFIIEPILSSDIERLVELGLLPECMNTEPAQEGEELSRSHLKSIQEVCLPATETGG